MSRPLGRSELGTGQPVDSDIPQHPCFSDLEGFVHVVEELAILLNMLKHVKLAIKSVAKKKKCSQRSVEAALSTQTLTSM